nr:MAG TPA: hypothetical protein [Caudoviricetes sp.]
MPGFIAKQPNGLFCRFSTIVDTVTNINMTKEDYINLCKNEFGEVKGEQEALDVLGYYLRPFQDVLDSYTPLNDSVEEFTLRLKEMGYDGPFEYREEE